jgi:hypothetical protein
MVIPEGAYSIRLIQEPRSDEIRLGVVPGTLGAEIAARALQAAMDDRADEADSGRPNLKPIRNQALGLRRANRAAVAGRTQQHPEVILNGEAAEALIQGLGSLTVRGAEQEAQIEAFPASQREPYLPALSHDQQIAAQADAVMSELLDQAGTLAGENQAAHREHARTS